MRAPEPDPRRPLEMRAPGGFGLLLVRRLTEAQPPRPKASPKPEKWEAAKQYEQKLRTALGTKVSLQRSRKGGKIVIDFFSDEEFSAIYERIVGAE